MSDDSLYITPKLYRSPSAALGAQFIYKMMIDTTSPERFAPMIQGAPLVVDLAPRIRSWLTENDPQHTIDESYYNAWIIEFGSEAAAFAFRLQFGVAISDDMTEMRQRESKIRHAR